MKQQVFVDGTEGITLAAALAANGTSITLTAGQGARYKKLSDDDFYLLTLARSNEPGAAVEVVKVGAANGDVLTITERAVAGSAQDWPAGTLCECRITAGLLNDAVHMRDLYAMETAQGATTYATAVTSLGDQMTVGGQPHRKTYLGNVDEDLFAYVIDRPLTIRCENAVIPATLNNSSLNESRLGSIKLPGDALRHARVITLSITVTADTALAAGQISFGLSSTRIQDKYRTKRAWTTTSAGNSQTLEVTLTALHASVVKMQQVQAATAPTAYPTPSQVVDVNTLANVEIPIYFKFLGPVASPPNCTITGMSAQVRMLPPKRFQLGDGEYRKPYLQPFASDDVYNLPILDNAVAPGVVYTHDWNSTPGQDNTAGTINAQGTAGSAVITLARTAGLKPGMFPLLGGVYATYAATDAAARYSSGDVNYPVLTKDVFGVANKILSVDSPTQVTMERPLVGNLMQRGRQSNGFIRGVIFLPNAETVSLQTGQRDNSATIGQLTGITKVAKFAKAYRNEFPVMRMTANDPLRTVTVASIVAPNGWLSQITEAQASANFGETIANTVLKLRIPALLTQNYLTNSVHNSDRNVVLITEDGRYTIEMYKLMIDATTQAFSCDRAVVSDLLGHSVPNILDRAEAMNAGISYGTRAWGGGLVGGVLRYEEWIKIPATPTVREADDVILEKLAKAAAAIPHALVMLLSGVQFKSTDYCPDPAVQSNKLSYFSYISQFNRHIPGIKTGGTGYKPGDSIRVAGGDYNSPMRCVVTAVNNGAVTGVLVTATGQYRSAPPDAANLQTSSSGAGTGLVLDATALAGDPSITSTAQAFPPSAYNSIYQYPATAADGKFLERYAGSFPMGGMVTIPQERDLEAEWLWGRKTSPTAKLYSYEFYAVMVAIQRYGAIVADMTGDEHNPVVADDRVAQSPNYVNLHSDTGAYNYPNYQDLKGRMVYLENASQLGKGIGTTPRAGARYAPPLYPINN